MKRDEVANIPRISAGCFAASTEDVRPDRVPEASVECALEARVEIAVWAISKQETWITKVSTGSRLLNDRPMEMRPQSSLATYTLKGSLHDDVRILVRTSEKQIGEESLRIVELCLVAESIDRDGRVFLTDGD